MVEFVLCSCLNCFVWSLSCLYVNLLLCLLLLPLPPPSASLLIAPLLLPCPHVLRLLSLSAALLRSSARLLLTHATSSRTLRLSTRLSATSVVCDEVGFGPFRWFRVHAW